MQYLIGIDLGTSATKTVLFDEKFQLLAKASREYEMQQPENGWAEQNPSDWWAAVQKTIRQVVEQGGLQKDDTVTIGLSGQMHGLVMLDDDNRVLRPAILWCDQRTAAECDEIEERVGRARLLEITANPALTGFTASKLLWVRNHEPENYSRCKHLLLPKDYIRFLLTGDYATDVSDASGMQFLDVPKRTWSRELLERLEIPQELLPRLYESAEITGSMLPEVCEKLGLGCGTTVVAGAGDCAASAVGTGVVRDGTAMLTIGSSGVVFAHSKEIKIDPAGRIHTFCAAVPGEWHVMGVAQSSGLSLKWYRQLFERTGGARMENFYREMDDAAEKLPIGSQRLLYLPYLMGERTPHMDPCARGVFFGLSNLHTDAHLYRAILEGVTFSLLDGAEIIRSLGLDLSDLRLCGGGSASPLWRQMISDAFDIPAKIVQDSEGAALGAAILASVGAGCYPSVSAACDRAVRTREDCFPDAERHGEYRRYYRLFQQLYGDLREAFQKLTSL